MRITKNKEEFQNISRVGENSKKMSEDIKSVISKMNNTDNAMGVLLTDTLFAQELKGTLNNVKSASFKLDENMGAFQHSFPLKRYFKKKNKAEEANN